MSKGNRYYAVLAIASLLSMYGIMAFALGYWSPSDWPEKTWVIFVTPIILLVAFYWPFTRIVEMPESTPDLNGWVLLTNKQPAERETVWLCNPATGSVGIGCWVWFDEGLWYWAYANGSADSENGQIIFPCEADDDRDYTHWRPLPKLPTP